MKIIGTGKKYWYCSTFWVPPHTGTQTPRHTHRHSATTSIHLHYPYNPLGNLTPYQSIETTKQKHHKLTPHEKLQWNMAPTWQDLLWKMCTNRGDIWERGGNKWCFAREVSCNRSAMKQASKKAKIKWIKVRKCNPSCSILFTFLPWESPTSMKCYHWLKRYICVQKTRIANAVQSHN